jgi:hypothetical protein
MRTTEEFIELANKIHNNLYDYSKINYINNRTNIIIICKIHGDFPQRPEHHLNGCGCPECKNCKRLNNKTFIEKSNIIHNNKYDYSLVNYINNKTKVQIICPVHGKILQRPDSHLRGIGCKYCGQIKSTNTQRKLLENFIIEANKIHGNKYDYTKTIYNGSHKKIINRCFKHDDFEQTPHDHLKGCGCPTCKESHGERNIRIFLQNNNIEFITQKTFKDCKYKSLLKFDFYLINYNICIEYDGKQHFNPYYVFGGEDVLEIQKIKDNIKTEYCNNNNIILFRIRYNENINDKLKELLNIINKK